MCAFFICFYVRERRRKLLVRLVPSQFIILNGPLLRNESYFVGLKATCVVCIFFSPFRIWETNWQQLAETLRTPPRKKERLCMSLSLHQTDERRDLGIISLFGAKRGGNGGLESSLVTPTSERTPPTIGEGKSLQKKDLHVYLNWEVPLPADIEDIAQVSIF